MHIAVVFVVVVVAFLSTAFENIKLPMLFIERLRFYDQKQPNHQRNFQRRLEINSKKFPFFLDSSFAVEKAIFECGLASLYERIP